MSAVDDPWLLYGATGYTGTLLAEGARARGQKPVLAGRDPRKVSALAERLDLPSRTFALNDLETICRGIDGVRLVLNAAGPFSRTSAALREGCLRTGSHYLDITGEISVFEACAAEGERARQRGVVLLPGVGFDVVPTDCLAAALHQKMPSATHLELALAVEGGSVSAGTASSSLEGMRLGGRVRRGGEIVAVPLGANAQELPLPDGPRWGVPLPWGDVSTAYHSTGIPNVVVYLALPARWARSRSRVTVASLLRLAPFALALPGAQRFLEGALTRALPGPDAQARKRSSCTVWGRVTDASGSTATGWLRTPDGYDFTVQSALAAVAETLTGNDRAGFLTPSRAFGWSFVERLPGGSPVRF